MTLEPRWADKTPGNGFRMVRRMLELADVWNLKRHLKWQGQGKEYFKKARFKTTTTLDRSQHL